MMKRKIIVLAKANFNNVKAHIGRLTTQLI